MAAANPFLIADFTDGGTGPDWYVVNDRVMGGRSDGGFDIEGGELHFAGRTDTNGGGFSSIRADVGPLDLSAYDGIRLRLKGDGRRYTWRLATNARYRGSEIGYWAEFETRAGEWQEIDIPFASFIPRFRGTRLEGPALDTSRIAGMGLMIYDGRDGPFDLRLTSVEAWSSPQEAHKPSTGP
jgi:NADH dehydrogenase [ubiquinone] 1 alpha subcomplex assembly factor 1